MGIEPTSAILSILRVAASFSTAARRLNRSAFGGPPDLGTNPGIVPGSVLVQADSSNKD